MFFGVSFLVQRVSFLLQWVSFLLQWVSFLVRDRTENVTVRKSQSDENTRCVSRVSTFTPKNTCGYDVNTNVTYEHDNTVLVVGSKIRILRNRLVSQKIYENNLYYKSKKLAMHMSKHKRHKSWERSHR